MQQAPGVPGAPQAQPSPPEVIQRLANEALPLSERLAAANEWRATSTDSQSSSEYQAWLQSSLPAVCSVLRAVPPQLEDGEAHKLRHAVLQQLSRLPQNDVSRPYGPMLFETCLDVLRTDNQENAILAVRLMFEILKIHKQTLEPVVTPVLDTIIQIMQGLPTVVAMQFGPEGLVAGVPPPSVSVPGMRSIRLVQELPLPAMFMIQMFAKLAASHMDALTGGLVEVIRLPGPDPATTPPGAAPLVADLRTAQIKCMQFVGSIVRSKPALIKAPPAVLAEAILHLFRVCPDNLTSRKELLVSLRSLVNSVTSHTKEALRLHLDVLLDESVLLGPPGGAARSGPAGESVRSLAYQITAELIHYARKSLPPAQLAKCVHLLSVMVANTSLPSGVRNVSMRVLMTLAESFLPIARNTSIDGATKVATRGLLTSMMAVLVACTKNLALQAPQLLSDAKAERTTVDAQRKALTAGGAVVPGLPTVTPKQGAAPPLAPPIPGVGPTLSPPGDGLANAPPPAVVEAAAGEGAAAAAPEPVAWDGQWPAGALPGTEGAPFLSAMQTPGEKERELLEARQHATLALSAVKPWLFITMNFAKTHQSAVAQAAGGPGAVPLAALPPLPPGMPQGITEEELRLLSRLWGHMLRCLPLLWHDAEPRDVCGKFVDAFSALDGREFSEVVHPRLSTLFAVLLDDPHIMLIIQLLVTAAVGNQGGGGLAAGRAFTAHLLEYMLDGEPGPPGPFTPHAPLAHAHSHAHTHGHGHGHGHHPPHSHSHGGAAGTGGVVAVVPGSTANGGSTVGGHPGSTAVTAAGHASGLCVGSFGDRLSLIELHRAKEGMAALKVAKVAIAALPALPDMEPAVSPVVARAVERSLARIPAVTQPTGYLLLLRAVFKAALHPVSASAAGAGGTGGKHRVLQAALEPHLPSCLALFTAMLEGPNPAELRPLLVELCLTLPLTVEAMPTYLPQLVRPLHTALSQGPEELILLGLRTLEVWIEAVAPEVLEAACSQIMAELMLTLWGLIKPVSASAMNVITHRALLILGRLGGRNRKWLHEPLKLEYKDNPEYGLRLILTFQPSMSFLTPLDKCMALAKAAMLSPTPLGEPFGPSSAGPAEGGASANDLYYRQQALRFLQVSLASVMNLRSCEEADVSPAGAATSTPAGSAGGAGGSPAAVDRLIEVLLGAGPVPTVPAMPTKVEQGVKTKTQLLAERSVLITLLSGVIAAAAEDKLGAVAAPFARDVCRHFAMLFAAGTQPPPPAPAMYRPVTSSAPGGAPHLSTMPLGLRELDPNLFLDALLDVLCDPVARRARAALDGIGIFLDTILLLCDTKAALTSAASGTGAGAGPADADGAARMEVDDAGGAAEGGAGQPDDGQPEGAGSGAAAVKVESSGGSALNPPGPASLLGLPPVLDALYARLLHCCADDMWQARLAGTAAIRLLVHQARLPPAYLQHWAAQTVRALLGVVRSLPEHSVVERTEVEATLAAYMRKVLLGEQPPPYKHNGTKDSSSAIKSTDGAAAPPPTAPAPDAPAAAPPAQPAGTLAVAAAAAGTGVGAGAGVGATAVPPGFVVPAVDSELVCALGDVLVHALLTPLSPTRMRDSAATAMQLLAEAVGTSPSALVTARMAASPSAEVREISSRRLLPLKGLSQAQGSAEALEYCCRLTPPAVTWAPPLAQVLDDAMTIVESEDAALLEQLPRGVPPPPGGITRLKVAALRLITGVIQLEGFRENELKLDDGVAPAAPPAAPAAPPAPATAPAPASDGGAAAPAAAGGDAAAGGAAGGSGGGAAASTGQAPGTTAPAPAAGNTSAGGSNEAGPRGDPALKRRLTLLLLNALAAPSPPIHQGAQAAVEALLAAQAKVSKVTLQHGLRPLLQNLGDHKKLTLPMLQGLSRLLEMLSDWFSVSLGTKLLEHLGKWTTPEGPAAGGRGVAVAWKPGEEAQVAAHMLHLFHLLPRQAVQFLETNVETSRMGLVVLTIELEDRLPSLAGPVPRPRLATSPYRPALTKYLNKYSHEAAAYFLDPTRICHERYLTRLLTIIKGQTPATSPLLTALTQATERLLPLLAMGATPVAGDGAPAAAAPPPANSLLESAAPFNAVHLVSAMAKCAPGWLAGEPRIVEALRVRWHSPERAARLAHEASLPRPQLLEGRRLAKALLTAVDAGRQHPEPLLDLFSILPGQSVVSFAFLERYCTALPGAWSDSEVEHLLGAVVTTYTSGRYSPPHLERIMQVLVVPTLTTVCEAGRTTEVLDSALVTRMCDGLLGLTPAAVGGGGGASGAAAAAGSGSGGSGLVDTTAGLPDGLQVELLRLTGVLLAHANALLSSFHRKHLISWAWRHLRRDNPAVVGAAMLTTVQYFNVNRSPDNVVAQVFSTLLRLNSSGQPELKRPLIRQALDMLIPLLVENRVVTSGPTDGDAGAGAGAGSGPGAGGGAGPAAGGGGNPGTAGGEQGLPRWIKVLKKIVEDATSAGHGPALWQLLLHQAHALYPYRAVFVPTLVHTATRLGLAGGSSALESRRTSLDLLAVLAGWEEQAERSAAAGTPSAPVHRASSEQRPAASDAPALSNLTGVKRPREESGGGSEAVSGGGAGSAQTAAKVQRTDTGSVATASAPAASATTSAAGPAGDGTGAAGGPAGVDVNWRPAQSQKDQVCGLLMRTALYPNGNTQIADLGGKDCEEVSLIVSSALSLLQRLLVVWPTAVVKTGHLDRGIPSLMNAAGAAQASATGAPPPGQTGPSCLNPPPLLTASLSVLRVLFDTRIPNMMRAGHAQVCLLVEPVGQTRSWACVQELLHLLRTLLAWQGPDAEVAAAAAGVAAAAATAPQPQDPAAPAPEAAPGTAQPDGAAPPPPPLPTVAGAAADGQGDGAVPAAPQEPVAAAPVEPSGPVPMAVDGVPADGAAGEGAGAAAPAPPPPVAAPPPPSPAPAPVQRPPEVMSVIAGLNGVLRQQLAAAIADLPPDKVGAMSLSANPQVLSQLCCALAILEDVGSLLPDHLITDLMPLLIRALTRTVKEVNAVAQHAATALNNTGHRRPAVPPSTLPAGPEYGTLDWAFMHCMRVCAPRGLEHPDYRKVVLSAMVNLVMSPVSVFLDRAIVVDFMSIVQRWIMRPYPGQTQRLSTKEAVLVCQRLGLLAASETLMYRGAGLLEGPCVQLFQQLCTHPAVPPEVRTEVFSKVERNFMSGLRSTHPKLRRQFFDLYHAAVPPTLFDRLHFIICGHDWEYAAHQFWLKHALDLLLAVLKEEDDILLAFNSSQVAPLLPGTKQNIFSPVMMHGRGAAAPAAPAAGAAPAAPPGAPPAAGTAGNAVPAGVEVKKAEGDVKPEEPGVPQVKQEPVPDAATGAVEGANGADGPKTEPSSAGAGEVGPVPGPPPTGDAGGQVVAMEVDGTDAGGPATAPAPPAAPPTAAAPAPSVAAAGGVGGSAQACPVSWQPTVRRDQVPSEVMDLVTRHCAFLQQSGQLRVRDMMLAAREYLHADTTMAYHLWVLMFPIVWATLEKAQQVQLAKPLITLLSKEWHSRQAIQRPNVIQALLDGIAVCQPQPKIPPELIRYLGKTYNAWQIAIPLLESHCVMFPTDARCFDALGQLYHLVCEEDMVAGLWRKRCTSEVTRTALWFAQTGAVDAAEELLGSATRMAVMNQMQIPRGEAALWVTQWLSAAKALNHWDSIAEYARATDQCELAAEAAWRLQDWTWLKECLGSGRLSNDDVGPSLTKCYMLLHEGDLQSAEPRIQATALAAVMKWWQLPDVGTAPQVSLLQLFQQLVELRESRALLADLTAGAARAEAVAQQGGVPPPGAPAPWQDTKDVTATWRTRTPNDWESLSHWQDVLVWRNLIYNQVIKAFTHLSESNPSLHQLGYRDKAWAVNKLGMVATAHGQPDTCLSILNTMYGYNAMEVQEAFVKIREQARAYLDKPADQLAGLNLLATTNLDYFQPHHQAELFRLKGAILMALKDADGAHGCFSASLQLCRTSGEAWVSWARLCDAQWDGGLAAGAPQPFMLEYTVHCLIQSIRLGAATGRALIPRLLCLLTFDNDSPAHNNNPAAAAMNGGGAPAAPPAATWSNVVGSTFSRAGGYDLPVWVWLAWLPQLLLSLSRAESAVVRPLLQQLAAAAPQALFYPLRVYLVSLREALTRLHAEMRTRQANASALQAKLAAAQQALSTAQVAAGGPDAQPPEGSEAAAAVSAARASVSQANREVQQAQQVMAQLDSARVTEGAAFDAGREINDVLRAKWPGLSTSLDVLVFELSTRFSPRQEERLLAVVAALLHRCYKAAFSSAAEIPTFMKKELAGVCKACFTESTTGAPAPPIATATGGATTTTGGGAAGGTSAQAGASGASAGGGPAPAAPSTAALNSASRSRRSALAPGLREQFVADMSPDSPSFPSTLGELMEGLKTWRAKLLSELEDRMPGALRLEEEAPALADLSLAGIEMPGAYCAVLGGAEPPAGLLGPLGGPSTPGDPGRVMLESIGASVVIVRRQGNAHRRLAFHGSDGRTRHMILQQNVGWSQHLADERILQLLRGFNRLLDAAPPSRSRALVWYTPAMVPVHSSVRLVEEDPSFTTYGEAYDINCTRYGREADTPILHFKKRCAAPSTGMLISDPQQAGPLRLGAYTEICEKLVTENVFSQYVYKTLPSCNHLWQFKKTFCTQSALSALLCHMLCLGGRAPNKILFAKDSGRVFQLELCTLYSDKGLLDRQDAVPCRLTRNMYTFFTSFGVEGMYLPALVNAAAAILAKTGNLGPLLALFFRDDITTWTSRRNAKALLTTQLKPEVLKSLVASNSRRASERLRMLAPTLQIPSRDELAGPLLSGTMRSPVATNAAKLVEMATDPALLCRMEPTWHPWF